MFDDNCKVQPAPAAGDARSAAVAGVARPSISRAADRPLVTHGIQSAMCRPMPRWSGPAQTGRRGCRSSGDDRQLQDNPQRDLRRCAAGQRLHRQGAARRAAVGQDIFYRIRFADLSTPAALGEPGPAVFAPRLPTAARFIRMVGDTAGQGWGIDEARGGMRMYATMRKNRPDFFIHSGDTIYADAPISAEVRLPDGTRGRNLVTEEKSKPAETLAEFRGNFKYNLTDKNLLAFNAEIPMFAQWTTTRSPTTGGRART